VKWDYALFKGAKLIIDQDGLNIGTNNLDLIIVKANSLTGRPNMSEVYAYDLNSPYNSSNTLPIGNDTFRYFAFNDAILQRGDYFLVANLSNPSFSLPTSSAKHFRWYSNQLGTDDGDTFYRSNTGLWSLQTLDHTFIPELLPCNSSGSPAIFSSPSEFVLKDNGENILSSISPIQNTGFHLLDSDTSVEIYFNNTYSFSVQSVANSEYLALNSTFQEDLIFWNISWNIQGADSIPYTIFERKLFLNTPSDWENSSTCYFNETTVFPSFKVKNGFFCFLSDNTSAGSIRLETRSKNYIQDVLLSDDAGQTKIFTLGYWTTDGSIATGHQGSTVFAEVILPGGLTTGQVNFTIFTPTGEINPLKLVLPANLSYTDTSPYSISELTSVSPGVFRAELTFDPSIYGTDPAGKWTAYVLWENGTEVGIRTISIELELSTNFNAYYTELPNSNVWTNATSSIILRKNGDSLQIRMEYFTNSEPFFTDVGHLIPSANVSYLTSWNDTGSLNDNNPYFNLTLSIFTTAGIHRIWLIAESQNSVEKIIELQIEVFNVFSIEVSQPLVELNETEDINLTMKIINETDTMKSTVIPDNIQVSINSNPITDQFFNVSTQDGQVILGLKLFEYGLGNGTHHISIVVSKENFRLDYEISSLSFVFTVIINIVKIQPQIPGYLLGIILGSAVLIITLIVILLSLSHRNSKKSTKIVNSSDKKKNVALVKSVLSLKKILFIHTETSLPVFELDIGQTENIDSSLVSGFLSIVDKMGKTIGGSETGSIQKIQYKNFVVNGASSETYTVFLFSNEEIIEEFKSWLFDLIMWFEYTFKIKDGSWDGKTEMFKAKKSLLEDKIAESLYLWLFFPMEVNLKKEKAIRKLNKVDNKIIFYVRKKKMVSLSEILKKFKDNEMEDVLDSVFAMINQGFLKRRYFETFR